MPIPRPELIKPLTQPLIAGELTRVAHVLLKEGQPHSNVIASLVTDHAMTIASATDLVVRLIQRDQIKDTIRTGVRFDLPDVGDIITFAGERLWLPIDKPDNEPLQREAGDEVMITRCVPSAPNVCYIETDFGGVTYGSDLKLDDDSIKGIVKFVDGGVGGRPSDKAMARRDQRTRQAFVPDFRDVNIDGDGLGGDDQDGETGEALNQALQLGPGAPGFVEQAQGEALSLTEPFSDIGYSDNVIEDSDQDKVLDTTTGKRAQDLSDRLTQIMTDAGIPPLEADAGEGLVVLIYDNEEDAQLAGNYLYETPDFFDVVVEPDDENPSLWSASAEVVAKQAQTAISIFDFVDEWADEGYGIALVRDGNVITPYIEPSDYPDMTLDSLNDGAVVLTGAYAGAHLEFHSGQLEKSASLPDWVDESESGLKAKKRAYDSDLSIDDITPGDKLMLTVDTFGPIGTEVIVDYIEGGLIRVTTPEGGNVSVHPYMLDKIAKKRSFTERQINRSKPSEHRGGSWWLVTAKEGDTVKQYVVQKRNKQDIEIKQASVESVQGPFTNMQVAIDNSTDGKPTIMISRRKRAENPEQGDYWTQNTTTIGPSRDGDNFMSASDDDDEDEDKETDLDSYGVVSE